MKLDADQSQLRVQFWGIDQNDDAKVFSFTVDTSQDAVQITDISHPLDDTEQYAEEAQLTGNYALLLRRMRRAFAQKYGT